MVDWTEHLEQLEEQDRWAAFEEWEAYMDELYGPIPEEDQKWAQETLARWAAENRARWPTSVNDQ